MSTGSSADLQRASATRLWWDWADIVSSPPGMYQPPRTSLHHRQDKISYQDTT